MAAHTPEYHAYLQSRTWRIKRAVALNRNGYRCERCAARYGLEVHHTTYARLGAERPEDLEVLCKACHDSADGERRQASAAQKRQKALNTFATKKYGIDWHLFKDHGDVANEFQAWLERKRWGD